MLKSLSTFHFFVITVKVSEITCKNDCRMSINGWFHVSTPPVFEIPPFIPPSEGVYGTKAITQQSIDIDLDTWISPYYLNPPAVREIQGQMEEDSEISLRKYFKDEPFNEVLECLQYEGVKWKRVGPPSRRWYEVLVEDHLPHVLDRFLKLFRSSAMFSLLSKYTELELRTDKASMKYELQRWTPGCYSVSKICCFFENQRIYRINGVSGTSLKTAFYPAGFIFNSKSLTRQLFPKFLADPNRLRLAAEGTGRDHLLGMLTQFLSRRRADTVCVH